MRIREYDPRPNRGLVGSLTAGWHEEQQKLKNNGAASRPISSSSSNNNAATNHNSTKTPYHQRHSSAPELDDVTLKGIARAGLTVASGLSDNPTSGQLSTSRHSNVNNVNNNKNNSQHSSMSLSHNLRRQNLNVAMKQLASATTTTTTTTTSRASTSQHSRAVSDIGIGSRTPGSLRGRPTLLNSTNASTETPKRRRSSLKTLGASMRSIFTNHRDNDDDSDSDSSDNNNNNNNNNNIKTKKKGGLIPKLGEKATDTSKINKRSGNSSSLHGRQVDAHIQEDNDDDDAKAHDSPKGNGSRHRDRRSGHPARRIRSKSEGLVSRMRRRSGEQRRRQRREGGGGGRSSLSPRRTPSRRDVRTLNHQQLPPVPNLEDDIDNNMKQTNKRNTVLEEAERARQIVALAKHRDNSESDRFLLGVSDRTATTHSTSHRDLSDRSNSKSSHSSRRKLLMTEGVDDMPPASLALGDAVAVPPSPRKTTKSTTTPKKPKSSLVSPPRKSPKKNKLASLPSPPLSLTLHDSSSSAVSLSMLDVANQYPRHSKSSRSPSILMHSSDSKMLSSPSTQKKAIKKKSSKHGSTSSSNGNGMPPKSNSKGSSPQNSKRLSNNSNLSTTVEDFDDYSDEYDDDDDDDDDMLQRSSVSQSTRKTNGSHPRANYRLGTSSDRTHSVRTRLQDEMSVSDRTHSVRATPSSRLVDEMSVSDRAHTTRRSGGGLDNTSLSNRRASTGSKQKRRGSYISLRAEPTSSKTSSRHSPQPQKDHIVVEQDKKVKKKTSRGSDKDKHSSRRSASLPCSSGAGAKDSTQSTVDEDEFDVSDNEEPHGLPKRRSASLEPRKPRAKSTMTKQNSRRSRGSPHQHNHDSIVRSQVEQALQEQQTKTDQKKDCIWPQLYHHQRAATTAQVARKNGLDVKTMEWSTPEQVSLLPSSPGKCSMPLYKFSPIPKNEETPNTKDRLFGGQDLNGIDLASLDPVQVKALLATTKTNNKAGTRAEPPFTYEPTSKQQDKHCRGSKSTSSRKKKKQKDDELDFRSEHGSAAARAARKNRNVREYGSTPNARGNFADSWRGFDGGIEQ